MAHAKAFHAHFPSQGRQVQIWHYINNNNTVNELEQLHLLLNTYRIEKNAKLHLC